MKKILFISTLALAMGYGLSSCESYLDINQDPNSNSVEFITWYFLFHAA